MFTEDDYVVDFDSIDSDYGSYDGDSWDYSDDDCW